MKSHLIIIGLSSAHFTGCASSYEPSSLLLPGGYSETKLGPDVVRIVFRGNSSTRPERAQDLALLRAADLSLQSGYPYFSVLEENSETRRSTSNDITTQMPKTGILVQFLKEKSTGQLTYDAAFLFRSLKEKYNIK